MLRVVLWAALKDGDDSTDFPAEPGVDRQRPDETAKVMSVVQSAIQRALRFSASASPRSARMNSTPAIGRKVVTERIGQPISVLPPRRT